MSRASLKSWQWHFLAVFDSKVGRDLVNLNPICSYSSYQISDECSNKKTRAISLRVGNQCLV